MLRIICPISTEIDRDRHNPITNRILAKDKDETTNVSFDMIFKQELSKNERK